MIRCESSAHQGTYMYTNFHRPFRISLQGGTLSPSTLPDSSTRPSRLGEETRSTRARDREAQGNIFRGPPSRFLFLSLQTQSSIVNTICRRAREINNLLLLFFFFLLPPFLSSHSTPRTWTLDDSPPFRHHASFKGLHR